MVSPPISIGWPSATSTAPKATQVRRPTLTSPHSTAVGATHAVASTWGRLPRCAKSIGALRSEVRPPEGEGQALERNHGASALTDAADGWSAKMYSGASSRANKGRITVRDDCGGPRAGVCCGAESGHHVNQTWWRILVTLLARVAGLAPALLAALPAAAPAPHQHEPHDENLGRVAFATSCRGEAQRRLERGVAYLHSFWYEKAGDAFKAALVADSGCAMGYWGTAMAMLHPLWTPPGPVELGAGLAAADRGLGLTRTPRETDYLSAIRAYYADYPRLDWRTR